MVLDEVMNAATPRRLDLAAAFLQCEALASGIRSASLLYRLLTNEVIEHLHCLSVTSLSLQCASTKEVAFDLHLDTFTRGLALASGS